MNKIFWAVLFCAHLVLVSLIMGKSLFWQNLASVVFGFTVFAVDFGLIFYFWRRLFYARVEEQQTSKSIVDGLSFLLFCAKTLAVIAVIYVGLITWKLNPVLVFSGALLFLLMLIVESYRQVKRAKKINF